MSRPICHFFHLNKCKKGSFCKFSHEPSIPLGYCPNGSSCRIFHDEEQKESQITKNSEILDVSEVSMDPQILNQNTIQFFEKFDQISQILKSVIPEQEKLLAKLDLDLMFVVDCTGSMGAWIDAIKKELSTIINHVQNEFQLSLVRVSFVGYRDFSDCKKQFSVHDFSTNIEEMIHFIGKQKAIGGGDLAEDVIGGLAYGLQQSWQSRARYAILICDAPSHGRDYYEGKIDDKYPDGDPNGRKLEELMSQYAKNGIIFYGIRINEITDKMYSIMNNVYLKTCGRSVSVANLGNSTKTFGFVLAASLSKTITETSFVQDNQNKVDEILKNMKLPDFEKSISSLSFDQIDIESSKMSAFEKVETQNKKELSFEFDNQSPNWNNIQKERCFKAICHTWFIVKDKDVSINWSKPLIQKSQISTSIWINDKPFSAGAMRFAFYMKDLELNQKLVAKIPKIIDDSYNPTQMMRDIEALFICTHIINEFNDRIISFLPDNNMLMNFVNGFIYEVLDDNFPFKFWWGENFIDGNYEKFNNNAGWESKNLQQTSLAAHALSHFSWQYTRGYLMIVDLQGGCGSLTDPQIHCIEKKRFGKGNLGIFGIVKFFVSHNCNYFCEKLNLVNPQNNIKDETLEENVSAFFLNKITKPMKNELLYKLCDLCRKPYQIYSETYYFNRRKFPELYCKFCEQEKNREMKEGKCCEESCQKTFKYSVFWFKMKRTDAPIRCHNCRLLYRNKMREELLL